MTDKKSNDSRRKLLKSIAAGSGAVVAGKTLPESWSKPVIDSVVLPSHATTTSPELLIYGSDTAPIARTGVGDWDGEDGPSSPIWICVVMNAGGTATITTQGNKNYGRRSGTIQAEIGTLGSLTNISVCPDVDPQTVKFTAISPESVSLEIYNNGEYPTYGFTVTANAIPSCSAGSFPAIVCYEEE